MPVVKPISGHSSSTFICNYLAKGERALACDYINLDPPEKGMEPKTFDWGAAMDATRADYGNDLPWRGMRVRSYKHYVVSPDPKDAIGLEALRELATSWAKEYFADFEVAIVYHDDNEGGIPHAHVVVNNTNLETGRRLQDPDPAALNRALQRMAAERSLGHFENTGTEPPSRRTRARPASLQHEYVRKAEAELLSQGKYSWTADMRSRVRIARSVARDEAEFRSILGTLGVEVSDNSPNAARRDWIYSFADRPSRRIGGERLGLAYGKEHLQATFLAGGANTLSGKSDREIARIAREAISLKDMAELRMLSRALAFIESNGIATTKDLERAMADGFPKRTWTDPGTEEAKGLAAYIRRIGILPEKLDVPEIDPSTIQKGAKHSTLGKPLSGKNPSRQRDLARQQQQRPSQERSDAR